MRSFENSVVDYKYHFFFRYRIFSTTKSRSAKLVFAYGAIYPSSGSDPYSKPKKGPGIRKEHTHMIYAAIAELVSI